MGLPSTFGGPWPPSGVTFNTEARADRLDEADRVQGMPRLQAAFHDLGEVGPVPLLSLLEGTRGID